FTEQQVLYFLVFFLISLLFVCLTMWLTCMCLDWRKRRGTKTVVTLALAEGELALATSRKLTQLRAAKEANRYYDTIIAIAVAFYSYISAVISRTLLQSTNNYHPTLATFASTLHEAAKTMQSENARASSHGFLERVLDPHDSYRVGSLRTPRPSAPPPAPPSGRIPTVETDIPTASARMTLIDDFTDEEEEPRPVIGIACYQLDDRCRSSMNISIAAQVDEELRSDRFFRIITVSAQVYMLQENSSEWRELSSCPVLVHLYNDGIENLPKLLSEHQKEMIIDCCPLLPSFAVHCPSKKFMHVTSNKYDPHSPVFGFGFSNAFELETLFLHLRRLKASTASSMAAAAVAAAGAAYPAHPATAALLASPRRSIGSPRLPSTPSHHHLAASAAPFSPRFNAAAAYKDSPYHGRHHSHPAASLPPSFHPAAAAAVAAHLQQHQQQSHHGMFGSGVQHNTGGNNGYSYHEFVPRRREMSSLSMDRISCGQPPLNTMMMVNEIRGGGGVQSVNDSIQGEETVEESLQPYFGYGEGDGGFGGLEDSPIDGYRDKKTIIAGNVIQLDNGSTPIS
ncbi:hypothetical protein PFISCL1PPCAC_5624, partial [Pristionchus fissidentatus]